MQHKKTWTFICTQSENEIFSPIVYMVEDHMVGLLGILVWITLFIDGFF
jgi:hypothetical protein